VAFGLGKINQGVFIQIRRILILLTLASILTQKVLYPVIVYLPIVFLLSIFPRKHKYVAWILIAVASFAALIISIQLGGCCTWLRANYQDFPSRVQVQGNMDKAFALQGKTYPDTSWGFNYPSWNPGFFQLVPIEVGDQLKGKTVTIGAWVWSDKNIHGYGPGLNSLLQFQDRWFGFKQEFINEEPQFIATVVQFTRATRTFADLAAHNNFRKPRCHHYTFLMLFWLRVLILSTCPHIFLTQMPHGIWDNRPFTNLARNAQFQYAWPYIEPRIFHVLTSKIQDLNPFHISSFLSLFLDIPGTKWYSEVTGAVIFSNILGKIWLGTSPIIKYPPLAASISHTIIYHDNRSGQRVINRFRACKIEQE